MARPVKVFISYASSDGGRLAKRLRSELQNAGAEVFQFEETARPGDPAWSQVAAAIESSDWFVVLVTPNAASSKPVVFEIEQATYTSINSEDSRPSIVPIVVHNAPVPALLKTKTLLEFTNADECSSKLKELLRLERTGKRPADSHTEALDCYLVAAPRKAQVGTPVYWSVGAENRSGAPLHDVVLRLDSSTVAGPSDLKPGKTLSAEVPVVYESPGTRRRTLAATAIDDAGDRVSVSVDRAVKVEAGARPGGAPAGPSTPTFDREQLQRILQGSQQRRQPLGTGARLPSSGTFAARDTTVSGTTLPSYSGSGLGAMLGTTLVVGVAMAVGVFIAVPWFLRSLGDWDVPGWVWWLPESFTNWPTTVKVILSLAGLAGLLWVGFRRADDVVVIDVVDSVNATFTAGLMAIVGALVWAYASSWASEPPTLAWQGVLAVAATTVGVMASIVVEEI